MFTSRGHWGVLAHKQAMTRHGRTERGFLFNLFNSHIILSVSLKDTQKFVSFNQA